MAKKDAENTIMDERNAKLKALQDAMNRIEKDYGKGSIMMMGESKVEQVDVIPTGSITLDYALGVGGYPCPSRR